MVESLVQLADVERALADFQDPETGRSALKFEQLKDIQVVDNNLTMTLALTSWAFPVRTDVRSALESKLRESLPKLRNISIEDGTCERAPQKIGQIGLSAKSVIAVGSGKGGVGKSTMAACLAKGLQRVGCRVGLLDTDVYGPSIPHLLGLSGQPQQVGNMIEPILDDGMPVMSIGFVVPADQAIVWRGPMLHKYVAQFLGQTNWGDLDYLIIDMPPGTGDIALSLSQLLPLTGAVVVCTPQDVALLDAVKSIAMFNTVKIPVLGMIENMSGFVCPDCNKQYDIFGTGGAQLRAQEYEIPFLGAVPINIQIRSQGDGGSIGSLFEDAIVAPHLEKLIHSLVTNLVTKAADEPLQPSLPILG